MSPFRYREEESSAAGALYVALGALAGFAAGVVVAQQYGGIAGLTSRVRDRIGSFRNGSDLDEDVDELGGQGQENVFVDEGYEYDDEADDEPLDANEELEERVLEAFRNDPVLGERAVDIGAIDEGIVELTGWVNADDEAHHAVTIARGVPGVDTVVNRLAVRADEELYDELAERYEGGDPSLTEGQWEGKSVGTGRRRQGNSSEFDRHEDPKPELEEAALEDEFLDMADAAELKAERRQRPKPPRGGRADGSAVGPSGVPKADHVVESARVNGKLAEDDQAES